MNYVWRAIKKKKQIWFVHGGPQVQNNSLLFKTKYGNSPLILILNARFTSEYFLSKRLPLWEK